MCEPEINTWDVPITAKTRYAACNNIRAALDKSPMFSMFTADARRAIAYMIADELPVVENV